MEAHPAKPDERCAPAGEKRAVVIGGGISGIQAALDLANARIRVTLVEKSPTLAEAAFDISDSMGLDRPATGSHQARSGQR